MDSSLNYDNDTIILLYYTDLVNSIVYWHLNFEEIEIYRQYRKYQTTKIFIFMIFGNLFVIAGTKMYMLTFILNTSLATSIASKNIRDMLNDQPFLDDRFSSSFLSGIFAGHFLFVKVWRAIYVLFKILVKHL